MKIERRSPDASTLCNSGDSLNLQELRTCVFLFLSIYRVPRNDEISCYFLPIFFFLLEDIDSISRSLHLWIKSCYSSVRRKNIWKFFTCYINFLRWNFTIKFLSLKARTKVGKHSEPISYRSGWFEQRIVKFQINPRRGIWAINLFYTLYYYYRKIFPIEFSNRSRFVCPCLRTFLEIFYFEVVDKSGTTIYV